MDNDVGGRCGALPNVPIRWEAEMGRSSSRAWRASCGRTPRAKAPAFTLMELLVVITVLALLVAILLPSFGRAIEVAYSAHCKNTLKGLGQAMRGPAVSSTLTPSSGGGAWTVPSGGTWMTAARQYGSGDLLVCKKDDEEHLASTDALEDYYILQVNAIGSSNEDWRVCSIVAILGIGEGVIQDPQVFYKDIPATPTPHTGKHQCWCYVPVRQENQELISITDEATILITLGAGEIRIDSIIGCGCTHCNSDHWLMKGHCTDGKRCMREDQLVMQLGGKNYRTPHSHVIRTETASYGINALIQPLLYGPAQLMLMDANQIVIEPGRPGWLDHVKDRHLGKLNVVDVGGSVRSMTKAKLQDEYLLYERRGPEGRSLWGHQACVGERKR
ncbi:MAG TPA: prepilin-type N-terminal cleavage/methylation domain-containing protein [Phycisphaerae bacterium]|nr:prepilin-type N-terminal cleavage/methylation domain-containing protein [Phycisphaerae bacterium]